MNFDESDISFVILVIPLIFGIVPLLLIKKVFEIIIKPNSGFTLSNQVWWGFRRLSPPTVWGPFTREGHRNVDYMV